MRYEELDEISRPDAEAELASGDEDRIGRAILRLALHDSDWRFVQDLCLQHLSHPAGWVRRNSATALGHVARIHGALELERVVPCLESLRIDAEAGEWAHDALEDIYVFLQRPARRAMTEGRADALIELLLDGNARVDERDDAAMDLARHPSAETAQALLSVATDAAENELLLASVGESLAEVWVALQSFDRAQLAVLAPIARAEAEAVLRRERPSWLVSDAR